MRLPKGPKYVGHVGSFGHIGAPSFLHNLIKVYTGTMHIGRSHHKAIEVIVAVVGGFSASFLTFVITTYTQYHRSLSGQLVAGDTTVHRELPTTLNMMHAAMDGRDPIASAMTNYGWWIAVLIGGVIASLIIFKLARRYV